MLMRHLRKRYAVVAVAAAAAMGLAACGGSSASSTSSGKPVKGGTPEKRGGQRPGPPRHGGGLLYRRLPGGTRIRPAAADVSVRGGPEDRGRGLAEADHAGP